MRHPEESQGWHAVDVSADKCGWILTSHPPAIDHKQPDPRRIEVKPVVQLQECERGRLLFEMESPEFESRG